MIEPMMAEVSAQELEGFGLGSTAVGARPGTANLITIESCNSTWLFDNDMGRFRRVPRATPLDLPAPDAEWQRFFRLEVDPDTDAFLVSLNESGSRLLRSFRHRPPCQQCEPEPHGTVELSLEAIAQGPGDGA
jgi:hypothetical protein